MPGYGATTGTRAITRISASLPAKRGGICQRLKRRTWRFLPRPAPANQRETDGSANDAVAVADASWLVRAIPASAFGATATVIVPTVCHVDQSSDQAPVNVLPLRVSRRNTREAVRGICATWTLAAPAVGRYCIAIPLVVG